MFRSAERFALTITCAALVVVFGLVAWDMTAFAAKRNEHMASVGQGDYVLQSTDGQPFTRDALKGAPSAVFFGYTHCPEVCPTTMGDIATWKAQIPGADHLRVYFVTVDPERDTLEQLTRYVSWMPDVRGVTGTQAETDKAMQSFDAYARKVTYDNGKYSMDHSAFVLLFDSDGRYVDSIAYGEAPELAKGRIKKLLGDSNLG